MQILKALVASSVFYIAGISAATLNTRVSSRASNVCKADGEHCDSTVDCCASFYCASRGVCCLFLFLCFLIVQTNLHSLCRRITSVTPMVFVGVGLRGATTTLIAVPMSASIM
jgi:hypothetical protein